MIELPEAFVLSEQLSATIKGKTIMSATANVSPHKFAWYFGDPAAYDGLLRGKTVTGAVAYAGQVELQAEKMRLLFSDGVSLRYHAEGEARPKKHQLLIEFDDHTALSGSVQMYGGLSCFAVGQNDNPYYLAAKEHPSPLTDAFNEAYFAAMLANASEKLSVKAFLATEQRIPGLGNGVLQDILFTAKIHPKRKLSTLSKGECSAMFSAVKAVLADMTMHGGRDTERDLFGCFGGYRTLLSKNTLDKPCTVCGGALQKQAYMGGSIYVCEQCQPLE